MNAIKYTLSVLCTLFVLAACGNKDQTESTSKSAEGTTSSKTQDAEEASALETKKWNSYINAYNSLDGRSSHGVARSSFLEDIDKEREAAARAGDFTKIKGSFASTSDAEKLTKTLSINSPIPAVDAPAKELLDLINQYLPAWKELEEYNKARRYEDDKGAKGKELLTSYIEGQKKIELAYEKFRAAVDAESKVQKQKQLEAYRASGNMLVLHKALALSHAESILELIQDDPMKALKNPASLEKANQLLAELEKELDLYNKAIEEAKQNNKGISSSYSYIYDQLVSFTGSYRDMRKSPGASSFNNMVQQYNQAVVSSNRIR